MDRAGTWPGLSLTAEHRRAHGALYDAVNCGGVDIGQLRRSLAGLAYYGPLMAGGCWPRT